jgi:hypothetical protein
MAYIKQRGQIPKEQIDANKKRIHSVYCFFEIKWVGSAMTAIGIIVKVVIKSHSLAKAVKIYFTIFMGVIFMICDFVLRVSKCFFLIFKMRYS